MPRKRKSNNKFPSATDSSRSCNATRNLILQNLQEAFASNLEPDVVATVFAECDDNLDATMEALFVLVGEKPCHDEDQLRSRGEMDPVGLISFKTSPAERTGASGIDFNAARMFENVDEEEISSANEYFNSDNESSYDGVCRVDGNENLNGDRGRRVKTDHMSSVDIDKEFENTISAFKKECFASSDFLNAVDSGISFSDDFSQLEENKLAVNSDGLSLNAEEIVPDLCSDFMQSSDSMAKNKYFKHNANSRAQGDLFASEIKSLCENKKFNPKNNKEKLSTEIEDNFQLQSSYTNDGDKNSFNSELVNNYPFYSLFPSCNNTLKTQTANSGEENHYFCVPSLPPSRIPKTASLSEHSFNSLPIKYSSKLKLQSNSKTNIPKSVPKQQQINKCDLFKNCDKKFRTSVELILNKIQKNELVLIILRGLPGSGKSTLASQLRHNGWIFSTDNYFMYSGKYQFDPNKLSEAHIWNRKRTKAAMINKCAPIIIDNTNVEMWEMKPYIKLGIQYQYHIEILEPNTPWKFSPKELFKKNQHYISKSKIIKMMERYNHNITIDNILYSKEPLNKNDLFPHEFQDNTVKQTEEKCIDKPQILNPQLQNFHSTEIEINHKGYKKFDSIGHQENISNDILSNSPNRNRNIQVNEAQNFFSNAYTCESPSFWKQYRSDQSVVRVLEKEIDNRNIKENLPEQNNKSLSSYKSPVSIEEKISNDFWSEHDESFDWNVTPDDGKNVFVMEEKIVSFSPKPRRNEQLTNSEEIYFQTSEETIPDSPATSENEQPKKLRNKIAANFNVQPHIDSLLPFPDLKSGNNTASSDELEICLPLPEEMEELAESLEHMMLAKAEEACLADEDDTVEENYDLNYNNWKRNDKSIRRKNKSSLHSNISFLKDCFPSITEEVLGNVLEKCANDIDLAITMVINSEDNRNKLCNDTETLIEDGAKNMLPKFQNRKKNETVNIENGGKSQHSVNSVIQNIFGNTSDDQIRVNDLNQVTCDERICLHLDGSFAQQLEQLFGPVSYCDENLKHIVYLDKEVARSIHENWKLTQQKAKVDNGERKKLYESACSRNLVEVSKNSKHDVDKTGNKSNLENYAVHNDNSNTKNSFESINSEDKFSNIEDLEFALQIYKDDLMKQMEQRWSRADLASKLKKQKLHELFPRIDQSTLDELLFANNFNLNDTVELIKTTIGDWDEIYAVEDEILEAVKKKSIEMMKVASKKSRGNLATDTSSADDISFENFRTEANQYFQLRQMYFDKAKEAYLKGMKPTALFYSEQARIYSEKMWEANENASVKILLHFNRGTNDTTLDLHLLYVKEALKVLEQFLHLKKLEQQRSHCKNMVLDIITGKGANSTRHIPRIKRSVISYLERNKYRFSEKNPGLIQVFL